jgi:hypothetical protein
MFLCSYSELNLEILQDQLVMLRSTSAQSVSFASFVLNATPFFSFTMPPNSAAMTGLKSSNNIDILSQYEFNNRDDRDSSGSRDRDLDLYAKLWVLPAVPYISSLVKQLNTG